VKPQHEETQEMVKTLYDYTYNDPSGYSYKGQVVADTTISQYNYVPGQTYTAPSSSGNGGTYTVSGTGTPTTAPSGAVYQTSYTGTSGATYDSYHYDPAQAAYYDINTTGYDHNTGYVTGTPKTPAWSGIGLGNEYSYVNTGTTTNPSYHTYGGGGTAAVNTNPGTPQAYDYKFLYPNGSYYLGKVVDDGTYGYQVGQTIPKGVGQYTIYQIDPTPPSPTALSGYNYTQLYHDVFTNKDYAPSDIIPNTPYYQKPVGYGGLGTEKDYIQMPNGSYYKFSDSSSAHSAMPLSAIPLPT
jgi:hypothetical protein